jgi:hypothetical protein
MVGISTGSGVNTAAAFMPRLPFAPVLARASLRSSLAVVFGSSS